MDKKICLIDNSEINRSNLENFLKARYDVVLSTNSGKTALESILKNKIDLVIMDVVIQDYDGFEFLEKINELKDFERPKILVTSSLNGEDFAQKAIDLGANYYMVKPVENTVVLKRVNEILEQGSTSVYSFKSAKNKSLDEKISNIFISVGIPAHIKGYQFLREAIKMAIDDPDIINSITKQLYPSIAGRFSTSASKVERAIRHAIEVAWNRGKIENINSIFGIKIYNSNEKPTNSEFIALVADKMLIEGA